MTAGVFRSAAAAAAVASRYRNVLDGWPVPAERIELPTCQGPTFALTFGKVGAPPVVLLHGAQANSAAWIAEAESWAEHFRLYAVDLIGEGGLSAPARPDLASDAHARWLDDVLGGLGLTHAALVGTSLGGWLALDYAIRRPAAVDALALVCPAGIGRQKNFLLKAAPLLLLGTWGRRRMRRMVFGPAPAEIPDAARPLARLMELLGKSIRPRVVRLPLASDADLAGLAMPVLAIMGGRDVLLDMHHARERLERLVPEAEVWFLEEGYHYLPRQGPRIEQFLARTLPV